MTGTPDDLPSPDEYVRRMAHVDEEFADARRYLSALCAEDHQGLGALMAEIHRSGRAMSVLAAIGGTGTRLRPGLSADGPPAMSRSARRVADGPAHRRD